MANDDHSLLSLDILDTAEIGSQHVKLERVHPFEELNEKKFRERFRLSKRATLYGKSHSQQTTAIIITYTSLSTMRWKFKSSNGHRLLINTIKSSCMSQKLILKYSHYGINFGTFNRSCHMRGRSGRRLNIGVSRRKGETWHL